MFQGCSTLSHHRPTIFTDELCVSHLQPVPCLFKFRKTVDHKKYIPLVTQVFFWQNCASRCYDSGHISTTRSIELGRQGDKMYRTLLTRRLLNTNYHFHISLFSALRNGARYPLERPTVSTRWTVDSISGWALALCWKKFLWSTPLTPNRNWTPFSDLEIW